MKLLFWLVTAGIAAFLVLFAASNREAVAVALWPLGYALELPLYLAIIGTFLVGFGVGAAAAWVGGGRWRREARRRRRRIAALERELTATQAQLPGTMSGPSAALAARS